MKALTILLINLFVSNLYAQDIATKEIKSNVDEVTVFLKGAQVIRKKQVELSKGKTIVKFTNLSPFIDAKSIQVKAAGAMTVLSVNHQKNYLDKVKKSEGLKELEQKIELIDEKIKLENTYLSIIKEELSFLHNNSDIGGKNEQVSIINLQQASEFYSKKLTSLKMREIERNKTLKNLNKEKQDLHNQINTLSGKKDYPTGEILVKVDAKQKSRYSLELSYLVNNAGWFPSYDIRAKNIKEPVQLVYKANVKQDTKVDWNNVKLKFSSANPNVSGVAPELRAYYINYNSLPPTYRTTSNQVQGKVMDSNGEPLPGATVIVKGTTIGSTTDFDGNYSITLPNGATELTYSYSGFSAQTLPIMGSTRNVVLQEDNVSLEEVVVTGYGNKKEKGTLCFSSTTISPKAKKFTLRENTSISISTAQIENQTSVDFEIKTPYTIKSDNKSYSVDMDRYNLMANYQYYCVPKINKEVYLMANIVNWEKYNLLEGEANIFFEGTYVGKTLMDVRYASDTLEISLGRDKMVSVNRQKVKDFTNKRFIGSKKEETRSWKITVKNNKHEDIQMMVLDQVPVSMLEEIEVNIQDKSGARHNTNSGEIRWELHLQPGNKKELDLKYSVKYPKNKNLVVE